MQRTGLKELRKRHHYTLMDVARALNVTQPAVSLWEQKPAEWFTPERIQRLTALFTEEEINVALGKTTDGYDAVNRRMICELLTVYSMLDTENRKALVSYADMLYYMTHGMQLPQVMSDSQKVSEDVLNIVRMIGNTQESE